MNLKKPSLKIPLALLATLFIASCQTSNGFEEAEIEKAIAEQTALAQHVDLPPMPEGCSEKFSQVKVRLPKGARLESDARRLRSGLDLANVKLVTANAQIERCGFWYQTIREGYNQPPAPLEASSSN